MYAFMRYMPTLPGPFHEAVLWILIAGFAASVARIAQGLFRPPPVKK